LAVIFAPTANIAGSTQVTGRMVETGLHKLRKQAPSKAAKSYGKPFLQIFKKADRDFYKIDHNLFAPAVLIIINMKTGRTFKAGQINIEALRESFNFSGTIL
jgi:methenyltetrahydromethanopterin cyclohydrolase